jgi:DNA-directed RNA polymerase subunit RPC12/RpoP
VEINTTSIICGPAFADPCSGIRYKCSGCGILFLRNNQCRSFLKNCENATMEKIHIDLSEEKDEFKTIYKCKACPKTFGTEAGRYLHIKTMGHGRT